MRLKLSVLTLGLLITGAFAQTNANVTQHAQISVQTNAQVSLSNYNNKNQVNINPQEIEKQIKEIEKLPLEERVKKMNELKEKIRNLNIHERERIIKEIAKKHHIKENISDKYKTEKYKAKEHIETNHNTIEKEVSHEIEHKHEAVHEIEYDKNDK